MVLVEASNYCLSNSSLDLYSPCTVHFRLAYKLLSEETCVRDAAEATMPLNTFIESRHIFLHCSCSIEICCLLLLDMNGWPSTSFRIWQLSCDCKFRAFVQ
eukprot:TRINITY_DN75742_c0_g1_i1.p1 TRINITY_DN75742_c0_g1~~TRINITY_DN75742_c0_g1_i1.p1  ORF type:complete len:101 (-),score=5.01 TRINITY_DN75742_c0_g1_i1:79-381(-)